MSKALLIKKLENETGLEISFLPETATHKHRMEIPGSTGNLYIVSQTKKNGIWQCACFGFRRHRHCKHLNAIVPVIESGIKEKPKKKKAVVRKIGSAKKKTVVKKKSKKQISNKWHNETIGKIRDIEDTTSLVTDELSCLINWLYESKDDMEISNMSLSKLKACFPSKDIKHIQSLIRSVVPLIERMKDDLEIAMDDNGIAYR